MVFLLGLLCSVFFVLHSAATQNLPVVNIPQGDLQGTNFTSRNGRTIFGFLGIPYAAPPVGELRFKSPQPAQGWQGIREATQYGSACAQLDHINLDREPVTLGSEDCLFINVFTPTVSPDAHLPVMVWIHGGAYFLGSSDMTGPEYFLDKDVVLVTLNYRLGVLGFLSTEDEVLPGNYGLKDQTAALKWVRDNIKYFGGNKDSVTIFGESAGGGSVGLHTMSPLSAGLFHAAIALSGTGHCPWNTFPPGIYRKNAERLGELVGCSKAKDSQQLGKCLRKLPHQSLTKVLLKFRVWDLDPMISFRPSIEPASEDAFLAAYPSQSISSVPLIVGIASGEGGFRLSSITRKGLEKGLKEINDKFYDVMDMSLFIHEKTNSPASVLKKIRKFYFGDGEINKNSLQEAINMYTDAMFLHGMVTSVNQHKGPVYIYYFDYKGSVTLSSNFGNKEDDFGVVHADTMLYTFTVDKFNPVLKLNKKDVSISEKIVELFTNFISSSTMKSPMRTCRACFDINSHGAVSGVVHADTMLYTFTIDKFNPVLKLNKKDISMSEKIVELFTNFAKYRTPIATRTSFTTWEPVTSPELEYLHISNNGFAMKTRLLKERVDFWNSLGLKDNLVGVEPPRKSIKDEL